MIQMLILITNYLYCLLCLLCLFAIFAMSSINYSRQKSKVSLEIPLVADTDNFESWFQKYNDEIDNLKEWVQAQENLDIYQLNAFYSGISENRRYVVNLYKTLIVSFIQTAGATYLAYDRLFQVANGTSQLCATNDFGILSWMAFAFTGFISWTLNDQLTEISNFGCYSFTKNLPPFFDRAWISAGILVNVFVLSVSIIFIFITITIT